MDIPAMSLGNKLNARPCSTRARYPNPMYPRFECGQTLAVALAKRLDARPCSTLRTNPSTNTFV